MEGGSDRERMRKEKKIQNVDRKLGDTSCSQKHFRSWKEQKRVVTENERNAAANSMDHLGIESEKVRL